ncbi:kinase-like domain-containing protein [Mycena epipterygia]|nr:kinase-like domain-containing protein [Mycena epipterygia]
MDHISWIEHHDLVRSRFVQLLSPTRRRRYKMDDPELKEWRHSVVLFAKAFAKKLKRKRDDFERKAQICIDVIHSLITLLRDNSEEALFQDDYAFLVTLCQKATLLPHCFVCSDTLQITEDAPSDVGASATVYRGCLGTTEVAVKSFRLYYRTVDVVKKRFIKEALILHLAQHPNVLRFINILNEPMRICIITPWYAQGHIMKYTAAFPNVPFKELLEQVADGLHFLSEYGIVHGDLKGGNILIDDDGKAVIADFGLSFIQPENSTEEASHVVEDPFALAILRAQCCEALRAGRLSHSATSISTLAATVLSGVSSTGGGTFRWMAPERLVPSAYDLPTAKATMKSDVYSFGMLILEVYSGAPPWGARAEGNIALSVVTNVRPFRPQNIPHPLWQIVEECWSHFPAQRPTILELYNRLACMV